MTEIVSINDIYPLIGDGRYQNLLLVVLWLAIIPVGIQQYVMVFVAAQPSWRYTNQTLHNETLKTLNIIDSSNTRYRDNCLLNKTDWDWIEGENFSIVTEFGLYCDKEVWAHIATSLHYIFSSIGGYFLAPFSDRYGRQKMLFYGVTLDIIFIFISSFSSNLLMFIIFKSLSGLFTAILVMTIAVYTAEIFSERKRTVAGILNWTLFGVAAVAMGILAYFLQNWRHLMLLVSAPFFPLLFALWKLPETIAWEFDKGDVTKIEKQISAITKVNKKTNICADKITVCRTKEKKSTSFRMLFINTEIATMTTCLAVTWFMSSVGYIGTSLLASNLTGNFYRDFVFINGSEIMAVLFAAFLSKRCGIKRIVIVSNFCAGVGLLIVAMLPSSSNNKVFPILRLLLGITGKFLTSTVSAVLSTWTAEAYPTYLRSKAAGFNQAVGFFGMAMAPWSALWLNKFHQSLPFYVMGSMLIIAAIAAIKVKETSGTKLLETIRDKHKLDEDGITKLLVV